MVLEEIETTNGLYEIEASTIDGKRVSGNNCFISISDNVISLNGQAIELKYKSQKNEIQRILSSGVPHVCYFNSIFNDGTFTFSIHSFAGSVLYWPEVTVAVDKDLQRYLSITKYIQFKINDEYYFIIRSFFKGDEQNVDNVVFSIISEKKIYDVEKLNIDDKISYKVNRKRPNNNNYPISNYFLVKGKLQFVEKSKFISEYEAKQLKDIMQNESSYLDAWKKYCEERGNLLLKKVREIGKIYFEQSKEKIPGGSVKLFVNQSVAKKLKEFENNSISIYINNDYTPCVLDNTLKTWKDYLIKKKDIKNSDDEELKEKEETIEGDVERISVSNNYIIIAPDNPVPKKGFFVFSVRGEEIQLERQDNAWNAIASGQCGIQHLGSILESKGVILQKQKQGKAVYVSQNVINKVFKYPPTDNQRDAIDVALRTPDIALIQGPPGTGKTTVITAILEQLNIMEDKHEPSAGKVLATSYQHDAVINMIEKLSVNSLPTFKFGNKRNEGGYREHIEQWAKKIAENLESKNHIIKDDENEVKISTALAEYELNPTSENASNLLNSIVTIGNLTNEISSQAYKLKSGLNDFEEDDFNREKVLRKIRGIRTTKESFEDDGSERIKSLYADLEEKLNDDEKKLLRKAALTDCEKESEENLEEMFKNLRVLRRNLLEEYSYKPAYITKTADPEIIELGKNVLNHLNKTSSLTSKKENVIYDWFNILENNSWILDKSIQDCDYIYASSAQQSVSKGILDQKENIGSFLYNTVIIDEAARAAPPDLLIPMCLASKRIILVGDHRQLPQLVDEDICKAVERRYAEINETKSEKDENNVIEDFINGKQDPIHLSMFEILFKRLKELEKEDGIKRTVTLNKQFRTHPVLGEFASKEFYEKYPGEGYTSDWETVKNFKHNLPGIENKAAVWLDVPLEKGLEEKNGSSYSRRAEVGAIVSKLKLWAESESGKNMSFGIITFYKGQEKELKKEVNKLNLNVKIKIGTVDSFQGMEFDVVFLSVVRANKYKSDNPYGFLCSVNRLCVSMSRQKKVLICAGAKSFCTTENARKEGHIPAIADFYDLCATSEWGKVIKC